MSLHTFLADIVGRLNEHGIAYMIGGSVASSIHGEPRTTRDVDIVIEVDEDGLRRLLASFDHVRYYVDSPAAAEPVRDGQIFNVIDPSAGWKADLVLRKNRPFSKIEFERRQVEQVLDVEVMVASPEDVILTKLEWAQRGGSARQVEDARGIIALQGERLDRNYLRRWAAELGVADVLDSLLPPSEA